MTQNLTLAQMAAQQNITNQTLTNHSLQNTHQQYPTYAGGGATTGGGWAGTIGYPGLGMGMGGGLTQGAYTPQPYNPLETLLQHARNIERGAITGDWHKYDSHALKLLDVRQWSEDGKTVNLMDILSFALSNRTNPNHMVVYCEQIGLTIREE